MKKFLLGIIALFSLFLVSCINQENKDDYKLKVSAPGGAPAIAAAELATTYQDDYEFTLGLGADALQPLFVNKSSDVIIAPINLGAKLYIKNASFKLAAVLTWGNLFFASQKEDFTLASMNDSDVTFFGEGTVNDVVVKYVLSENNISPKSITYLGSTSETQTTLITNSDAIVLIAEPALSVAKNNNANIKSISVQELYKEASGNNEFPQAGCFINVNTLTDHKSVVNQFLKRLEESTTKCATDTETIAGYAETLALGGKKAILVKAIPNCNIKFVKAKNAKAQLEFAVSINQALFGGANPVEEFYYEY